MVRHRRRSGCGALYAHPMPLTQALAIVAGIVVVALVLGLVWQRGQGRSRSVEGQPLAPAEVGTARFADGLTLLLLTTRTCGRCPAARRVLDGALRTDDLRIDVDLERHPAIAERFGVLQTPTTIVLDRTGAPRARIAGVPEPAPLRQQLDRILEHA